MQRPPGSLLAGRYDLHCHDLVAGIQNPEFLILWKQLVINVDHHIPGPAPVQGIKNRYGRKTRPGNKLLNLTHHLFAQDPVFLYRAPYVRFLFPKLHHAVFAQRIGNTFGRPECVLIIKCNIIGNLGLQFGYLFVLRNTHDSCHGHQSLVCNIIGMSCTGIRRLDGGGSESVHPPVGPCAANNGQFIRVILFHVIHEFRYGGQPQLRPGICFIPFLHQFAGRCRRRRVIGKVSAELDGIMIERVPFFRDLLEMPEEFPAERFTPAEDAEAVAPHVVFGAVYENAAARRGDPPESGGVVEGFIRPGGILGHVQIFYPGTGKVIGQAPWDPVDVALHGSPQRKALIAKFPDRLKGSCHHGFISQVRTVQKQAGQLDPAFAHPLSEAFQLRCRPRSEVFPNSPGSLACPSESCIVGQRIGLIAKVERIINVPQVIGKDFRLRAGVADVGVGMLDQIYGEMAKW